MAGPRPPFAAAASQRSVQAARDELIDTLRALSLLVVVLWHWVFTTITWRPDGPHASNPIGVTRGLWLATWLLQVLPLFFFAGGYVHGIGWERSGGGRRWVRQRLTALLAPAASLLLAGALGYLLARRIAPGATWLGRGIVLILSPLWFLAMYAILVAFMPLWRWMHERLVELGPVVLAGAAVVVDVMRFSYGWPYVEFLNLLAVWALAHQLGFFYERLVAAPRRFAWALAIGGLVGLFGLTNMRLYPRSMVGVPGEAISNMAPPTLPIAALTIFQIGVVLLAREPILRWARSPGAGRLVALASSNAMRIFLWHAPGFAVVYGTWRVLGLPGLSPVVDARWWLLRPLWLLLPIVPTMILAQTLGRLAVRAPILGRRPERAEA